MNNIFIYLNKVDIDLLLFRCQGDAAFLSASIIMEWTMRTVPLDFPIMKS